MTTSDLISPSRHSVKKKHIFYFTAVPIGLLNAFIWGEIPRERRDDHKGCRRGDGTDLKGEITRTKKIQGCPSAWGCSLLRGPSVVIQWADAPRPEEK